MNHPSLGELKPSDRGPQCLRGEIEFDGRLILIDIDPDGERIEDATALAVSVAESLFKLDSEAKAVIVRDLLKSYNSGWNSYSEAQADGTFKDIVNPQLNAEQFRGKMLLNGISILGASCVEYWYEDGGLFWGHSVFVTSFEGLGFTEAGAQLFG